jgi:hypothetical protein
MDAGMLPFIDPRPAPRKNHPTLDSEEIARLRELPPVFARPIEDDDDIPRLIADAMTVATTTEDAGIERRALGAALVRRAHILEQAADELALTVRMLDRARTRLGPNERDRAAIYGPVLAIATHPRGETDERTLHKAAVWLGSLDGSTAARAIEALRRERAVLEADDLRCRAYHALAALLTSARR